MSDQPPTLITINQDNDGPTADVGRTADGRQFFLTTPFIWADGEGTGRDFVAAYLFDAQGRLIRARVEDLGPRSADNPERQQDLIEHMIGEELGGGLTWERIEVAPFAIERFGTTFGLVPTRNDDGSWSVIAQPGMYMFFDEPWDNGEYDT